AVGALLSTWTAAATPSRHTVTRGPIVTVGSTDLGQILVDARGRTLYLYTPDTKSSSTCYGQCAAFWPPLYAAARPLARHGVKASLLGTTKRKDGKLQVTYGGHPLYYFVQDKKAGDVKGQGFVHFGGSWWVVSAAGTSIKAKP